MKTYNKIISNMKSMIDSIDGKRFNLKISGKFRKLAEVGEWGSVTIANNQTQCRLNLYNENMKLDIYADDLKECLNHGLGEETSFQLIFASVMFDLINKFTLKSPTLDRLQYEINHELDNSEYGIDNIQFE